MMREQKFQHIVPGIAILAIALSVAWVSFTQEPAEAFLFPQLISIFFVLLAVWNVVTAVMGASGDENGVSLKEIKNIAPGVVILLVVVFFAAKFLGFYFASYVAFLAVYTVYDPVPVRELHGWIKRVFVTTVFLSIMYAVFVSLLSVYTPRGILF